MLKKNIKNKKILKNKRKRCNKLYKQYVVDQKYIKNDENRNVKKII